MGRGINKNKRRVCSDIISVDRNFIPMQFYSRHKAIKAVATGKAKILNLETWEQLTTISNFQTIQIIVFDKVVSSTFATKLGQKKIRNKDLFKNILERDEYKCIYCLAKATTIDHVIPLAKGGLTRPNNLAAACLSCNQRKGDKLLHDTDLVMQFEIKSPTSYLFQKFNELVKKKNA